MDIKKKLQQKRNRKYALIGIGLAVCLCIGGALLSIESSDSKLADGQGNVVVNNEGSGDESSAFAKDKSKNASTTKLNEIANKSDEEKAKIKSKDIKIDNSKDPTASNQGNKALKPKEPKDVTVTVEIRCDTVSKNMSVLENEAIKNYIPSNGTILAKTTYKGTTENTVFDALNTVCRNNDVQIEYEYQAGYDSYYVKGINYLYELDCGMESGWLFKVNGWFPNYGCSNYYLSDGDVIVWHYTCKGYGADL